MKNFCIFCGKGLVGGACNCAEYISYYGAPAAPVYTPPVTPAPAPAEPVYTPPVAPAPAPAEPVYTPPVAPAPAPAAPAPADKPMDSHFQSAGDL